MTPILAAAAPARLLAASNSGVLLRSFLLAVVVVSPFALRQWWKGRSARLAAEAAAEAEAAALAPDPGPALPRFEEVVERIAALARDTAAGAEVEVEVPSPVTIDGAQAPPALVDALLGDALRRSGFEQVGVADDPSGRVVRCRRL